MALFRRRLELIAQVPPRQGAEREVFHLGCLRWKALLLRIPAMPFFQQDLELRTLHSLPIRQIEDITAPRRRCLESMAHPTLLKCLRCHEEGCFQAQRQVQGIARSCVDLMQAITDSDPDRRILGIVAQIGDRHPFHRNLGHL
jgi:hypothetical protein